MYDECVGVSLPWRECGGQRAHFSNQLSPSKCFHPLNCLVGSKAGDLGGLGRHIVGGEFNGHSTLHESIDLLGGGQAYSSLWSPHPDRHGTLKRWRTKGKTAEAIFIAAENQGVKSNQI